MDISMFDDIFRDGAFTEERLDAVGVLVMSLATKNKDEATKAKRLLADLLLFAIADGRCARPHECAAHYYSVMNAAFGEPTLLDSIKTKYLPSE